MQRLLPSLKNKVAPKASRLWEKTTTKIETIRDRVTGKTERELQAEREALMEEVELLRESNAAVGRLQQKTAAELEATKAKADEEIALLKQNTLKELESTKAQAERRVETVRQAPPMICMKRVGARSGRRRGTQRKKRCARRASGRPRRR